MTEKLIKFIATFGGLGYSKIAPGTAGCLGALLLYLLSIRNPVIFPVSLFALFFLGFLVSTKAEVLFNKKDAGQIVIDDACGLLVALLFIPFSYTNTIIVFLLFRTIDIIKPFPIRKVEGLPGSLGIMGDDILAGIYANLIFRLALKLLPI